ncbi:hypothetical protein PSACC_03417 [Paramicrosporidium saccamoebae]|uniref:Uncharacterized protein n=1 Tax=Paramicrosporidium saccamoebae TaxID=1246581 RepID=A0A2H9TG28_9FUNG|nr:hypothetical protein PSACC_03417 [Paramicrosporidium saccamoebae]
MSKVSEDDKISTSVEDSFFLAQKCCTRAIAVGESSAITNVLEGCKAVMNSEMIVFLQRRMRQLVPDAKTGDSIIIAVNDAAAGRDFLERLVDELRELSDNGQMYSINRASEGCIGELDNLAKSKINTSLNGLDSVGSAFRGIVKTGLESINSIMIKSKIVPFLAQLSRDLATAEGSETPLLRLIPFVDKTLLPHFVRLVDENQASSIMLISNEISQQIEQSLLGSKWTIQTATNTERNLRKLISYLADLTELQAKDLFIRSNQMLSIITCDTHVEAAAYVEISSGNENWRLTEGESKTMLASRIDWK